MNKLTGLFSFRKVIYIKGAVLLQPPNIYYRTVKALHIDDMKGFYSIEIFIILNLS